MYYEIHEENTFIKILKCSYLHLKIVLQHKTPKPLKKEKEISGVVEFFVKKSHIRSTGKSQLVKFV